MAAVELRPPEAGDYEHVIVRLDDWWGGRHMAPMVGFAERRVEDYDGRGEPRMVMSRRL